MSLTGSEMEAIWNWLPKYWSSKTECLIFNINSSSSSDSSSNRLRNNRNNNDNSSHNSNSNKG